MISVIVPTYNEGQRPESLLEMLDGVPSIGEIIIVDASDEELSRNHLRELRDRDRLRVVFTEKRGRARQMNHGAEISSGDILVFLHCDTRLPVDTGSCVEAALKHHFWGRFDIRLDAVGWQFRLIGHMINLRSRLTRIATGDQTIFVQRDFFLAQRGFSGIPLMEDIEFSRRVGRRFRPGLVTSPVVTSARRWLENGTGRTILLMWKLRVLYRLGVSPDRLARMYRTVR